MSEKKAKRGRRTYPPPPQREDLLDPGQGSTSRDFAAINQPRSPSAHIAGLLPFALERKTSVPSPIPHGTSPDPSSSSATMIPPGKIPIPAIKREVEPPRKPEKKIRTSHACDNCRKAKAGCSGEHPCSRCRNTRVPCIYGDGKRDRERKRISKLSRDATILNQYTAEVADALRRIRDSDGLNLSEMKAAIDRVLSMTPRPLSPDDGDVAASVFAAGRMSASVDRDEERSEAEPDVNADVGSTGSVDLLDVDLDSDETRPTAHRDRGVGHALSSYHAEDADLENVDTRGVDPYEWPDRETSDALLQLYWNHVHDAFPVLDRRSFMTQYTAFPRGSRDLSRAQTSWLCAMNAMWAIGSVYARLSKRQGRGQPNDHLYYIAKARRLCRASEELFEDARISSVGSLGLMCLYYLCTDRLNRAWTICGLALRKALALSLHGRLDIPDLSDMDREYRTRLWWSLYSLECQLGDLTGRPTCIADQDISTPLPINVDEDDFRQPLQARQEHPKQPSRDDEHAEITTRRGSSSKLPLKRSYLSLADMVSGSEGQAPADTPMAPLTFPLMKQPITSSTYFRCRTQLCIIAHKIVTKLYCAETGREKWHTVQEIVQRIDYGLLEWRENLPKEFDISFDTALEPDWSDPYLLQRTGLAMFFNSSRMILFRPCLCRFEGRITQQTAKNRDFTQDAVRTCIRSAQRMISLFNWFPPSSDRIYGIPHWWTTLHYLCEALSILMLEMAFQAQHLPDEASQIFEDAKKGIKWLVLMSEHSVSARKAWEIYDSLIRLIAPVINFSAQDLPTEAPVPPGYNTTAGIPGGADSSRRLKSVNLQQYDSPPQKRATAGWATGSQEMTLGQGGPGGPGTYVTSYETLPNPLGHNTALERFHRLSVPHGQYDEPWHQLFNNDLPMLDVPGPSTVGSGAFLAEPPQYFMQSSFPGFQEQSSFSTAGGPEVSMYSDPSPAPERRNIKGKGKGKGKDMGRGGYGGAFGKK